MNGEKAVHYVLSNDATYNAHVGGSSSAARIYYDEVEQSASFPNAMVTLEGIETTDTKDNSDFDHDIVQVFHSAAKKTTSLQMATDARTALEAASGSINGVTVSEIRLVDQDSFTENIVNNKIFTTEQIYKVTVNL